MRSAGRVELLGSVADVVPLLHAADVLLSTSSTEGMPGSLIEAVLCGLPVVATDVGAVSALLAGSPFVVVPPGASSAVIAAAIEQALTMPPSKSADATFTWGVVAPAWLDLIRSVARG